jgi:hypothetical protein
MAEIVSKPATKKYRDNYDRIFRAGVAQLVERLICNQSVGSSRLPASSKLKPKGMVGIIKTSLPKEVVQEYVNGFWVPE